MATGRRLLEQQAARIESVLAEHKVKATVRGGVVMPRTVRFELQPEPHKHAPKLEHLTAELAVALGAREARVAQNGDSVTLEIPRAETAPVRLLPLAARIQMVPPCTVILGVDGEGAPLLARLPSSEVGHLLIAGATGCGKTALARTALLALAMFQPDSEVNLVLIDPKGRGFASLVALPHVLGDVAVSPEAINECLRWLVNELERREKEHCDEPHIVVAVDELADLVQGCGKGASSLLARIALRGREVGMHLIACTQKPTTEWIGSDLKAAFPLRAVGYTADRDEARYASGINESGAERLGGRGDFLLVAKGEVIRFQAAWVGKQDLRNVQAALAKAQGSPLNWSALDLARPVPFDIHHPVEKADPRYGLLPAAREVDYHSMPQRTSLWSRLRRVRPGQQPGQSHTDSDKSAVRRNGREL